MSQTTEEKTWMIRDVDTETKRLVKVYAAENGINIAAALAQLVRKALNDQTKEEK